jgi:hypothetical protein
MNTHASLANGSYKAPRRDGFAAPLPGRYAAGAAVPAGVSSLWVAVAAVAIALILALIFRTLGDVTSPGMSAGGGDAFALTS